MSKKILRNESTEAAREVWKAVDSAASKAPLFTRKKIQSASLRVSCKTTQKQKVST